MTLEALVGAAAAIRDQAAESAPWITGLPIAGVGWATVELDRAAVEVGARLAAPDAVRPSPWQPAGRDTLLGAAALVARPGGGRGPAVVLLEPDTEGRLAASLARFGEGLAAVYLAGPPAMAAPPLGEVRYGSRGEGPLGTARLLLRGPRWGPHIVVVDRPGTE